MLYRGIDGADPVFDAPDGGLKGLQGALRFESDIDVDENRVGAQLHGQNLADGVHVGVVCYDSLNLLDERS